MVAPSSFFLLASLMPTSCAETSSAASPPDTVAWGETVRGLRLGTEATGPILALHLENAGTSPLTVLSHVSAGGERHLDWTRVAVVDAAGASRSLRLTGPRDRAGRVQVALAPGERTTQTVDLAHWSTQPVNGGAPLPDGAHAVTVIYEVQEDGPWWQGRVQSGQVTLTR